jgi:capsular polysaccharide biosynthesis protein
LLAVCLLVAVNVVGAMLILSPVRYVASARIQESSANVGTDIEAASVLNRAQGIATSPAVVGEAMRKVGLKGRSAMDVGAHDITVTAIGTSPVLDVSVSDANRRVAQDLSNAVARIVVDTLGGQQDARKKGLMTQVRQQQQQLYAQRKTLLTNLADAGSPARVASLSAQLSSVDQQLADVSSTLLKLELPDPTDGSAMFISPAQDALPVRHNTVTDLALALVAGLVAGLLAASLIEIARPRVANVGTLARDLGVPFLGDIAVSPGTGSHALVRQSTASLVALTGAATRCGARTVVVTGCGEDAAAEATLLSVSRRLRDVFAATPTQNGHVGSDVKAHQPWPTPDPPGDAPASDTAQKISLLRTDDELSAAPAVVDVRPLTTSWDMAQARGGPHALVVVASPPVPQRDIDRVVSLASATGWPVLGVLALRVREDAEPIDEPRMAPGGNANPTEGVHGHE